MGKIPGGEAAASSILAFPDFTDVDLVWHIPSEDGKSWIPVHQTPFRGIVVPRPEATEFGPNPELDTSDKLNIMIPGLDINGFLVNSPQLLQPGEQKVELSDGSQQTTYLRVTYASGAAAVASTFQADL